MVAKKNSRRPQTVGDYLKKIEKAAKGGEVLFRGQASSEWRLESSAVRRIARSVEGENVPDGFIVDEKSTIESQTSLLADARKLGLGRHEGRDLSDIELLTELQHFNAATVLLDFTENPIVAIYFACQGEVDDDGKVFCLRRDGLSAADDNLRIESLILSKKTMQWVPAMLGSAERRIIKQSSVLLLNLSNNEEDIESVKINKADKKQLIRELRDTYKVSADSLFNDLSGFANSRSVRVGYDDAFTKFYHGMKLEFEGKFLDAIAKYSEAIEENSSLWEALNNRGNVKSRIADFEGAISDYDAAINLTSDVPDVFNNRGVAKAELGHFDEAIADYDISIGLLADNPIVFANRGVAKFDLEDYEGAIADYNITIGLKADNADVFLKRGNAKVQVGDLDGALADYDVAVQIQPDFHDAFNNRAGVKLSLGDYVGSVNDCNEAVRLKPDLVSAFFNRAIAQMRLGDFEEAIHDFGIAISLDPSNADAYNNRGNIYSIIENYKAALADYDSAIRLDLGFSMAFSNRGLVKSRLGNQTGAIADCDIAISLDPEFADAFENRGVAKLLSRDLDGSLSDFQKSVELEPNISNLAFKGALLAGRGEEELAEGNFHVIISLIPMLGHELDEFLEAANIQMIVDFSFDGNQAAIDYFERCIEAVESALES